MLVRKVVTKQNLIVSRLKKMIRYKNINELRKYLKTLLPEDIANSLAHLNNDEKMRIFLVLPIKRAGIVLDETDKDSERYILDNIGNQRIVDILAKIPEDEAVDILSIIEEDRRAELLDKLTARDGIEELMDYPDDTAGGIMSTEYLAVKTTQTIHNALSVIRKYKNEAPELYHTIYVIDEFESLIGKIPISQLLKYSPQKKINSIYEREPIRVQHSIDQEEVARIVSLYNMTNIPVVDEANKLIGVVYVEDVIDVIEEETTEDFYKMAGINHEEAQGHFILRNTRMRLPWLLTTILGGFFTASIVTFFKPTMDEVISLAVFMPIIAAMSGNIGIQSSSILIRGLATGSTSFNNFWSIIYRELRVGAVIGAVCGLLVGFVVHFWRLNMDSIDIGLAVGIAMMVAMTVAAVMGTLIPFLLDKLHIDPAVATGPFVTIMNDIVGLTIYFSVANILLKI